MQAIQNSHEISQQQLYLDSIIQNMKLQYDLSQIDKIIHKLQDRERYLFAQVVHEIKNNSPSGVIYAKELQRVRTLKTTIYNIKHRLKVYHFSLIVVKKHVRGKSS